MAPRASYEHPRYQLDDYSLGAMTNVMQSIYARSITPKALLFPSRLYHLFVG